MLDQDGATALVVAETTIEESSTAVAVPPRRSRGARTRRPDPWADLEWEEHAEARRAVATHPDGMTLEEVGSYIAVTRERVRQIEAEALRKLRDGLELCDTVTMGGHTIALLTCESCGELFVRGRGMVCDGCLPAEAPPRRKRAAAARKKQASPRGTPTKHRRRGFTTGVQVTRRARGFLLVLSLDFGRRR